MRNLTALLLFLCVTMASCIVTLTHYNDYNRLSTKERTYFRPFDIADIRKEVSYSDSCVLQQIQSKDISAISKVSPIIWVKMFTPWCGTEVCENLGIYQRKAVKAGTNVKLVLISIGYQYNDINAKLKRSGINQMVYVLDTCYGRKVARAEHQFFSSIKKAPWLPALESPDSYIIKNDTIVWIQDHRKPDSVFRNALGAFARGETVEKQVYPYN